MSQHTTETEHTFEAQQAGAHNGSTAHTTDGGTAGRGEHAQRKHGTQHESTAHNGDTAGRGEHTQWRQSRPGRAQTTETQHATRKHSTHNGNTAGRGERTQRRHNKPGRAQTTETQHTTRKHNTQRKHSRPGPAHNGNTAHNTKTQHTQQAGASTHSRSALWETTHVKPRLRYMVPLL